MCIYTDGESEGWGVWFFIIFQTTLPSEMGGAMAPPMKDIPRWLEENPEFAVAPDWTDIVKQSVSTDSAFLSRKENHCFPDFFFTFC